MPSRVLVVFGTRPEAIKMAPVIEELACNPGLEPIVAVTAQHRDMLDQVLGLFGIEPDVDLDIMEHGQTLTDVTMRALAGLSPLIERERPEAVLVQGDTTTTFVAALAAFYHKIPVGHVEAGLRTNDLMRPYPEEANRRLTTQVTRWHFPPTATAAAHLIEENIDPARVYVTGNTVIDALLQVKDKPYEFGPGPIADALASGRRIVLVTAHRRESWGEPMEHIFQGVAEVAERHPDVHVLVATHANPLVAQMCDRILGGKERVDLIGPQEYLPFVKLMDASTIILSDSGGVQEEAPSLGKPVLVLRERTERPEAVEAGCVKLVGTDTQRIADEATRLLTDPVAYEAMARVANPFGDGTAARQICDVLSEELGG
ncbi:MAG: UDP-N-acetylglucosamine 2-epimerase (non-hydrolyzing) [Coriobacteriales bacterium]|nr:UDP-N-acetylglucosamine 2-epimerase (non-hydrolyzing) [Coriobacteriales bacterium]